METTETGFHHRDSRGSRESEFPSANSAASVVKISAASIASAPPEFDGDKGDGLSTQR